MSAKLWRHVFVVALLIGIWVVSGCDQGNKNNSDVFIMFEGRPKLYGEQVYHNGHSVGKIRATEFKGSTITRLAITIAPDYIDQVHNNWAFYADGGRLLAVRLSGSGAPLMDGDKLCGFSSKAAYNWFKFKTLLSDRAYKAGKRANNLYKRFKYS